ncbi:ATP-binding protein [uncultured Hymenobacter sp.]|uniref:ATP-binding protein n=1 Tax=uncultured Hymenobacter sp. TaxID=170016 RepID=UPI0035CC86EE
MSLKLTLAAERRKREAAEAEVARLRTQLEALSATASVPVPLPTAAQDLADIVSQLKLTEQQLEDQQGLVRQVIDTSPNLVYVEDEQGRCILANKSYVQLLRQQDGPSRPSAKQPGAAPAPGYPRPVGPIDTSISASFEESFQLKDGSTVWYSTTKSPLVRTDGSRYLLTFSSDITDLKRATRVAEESVQAKQIFMANMSHEIRTPLHGVMGLAELLKKEPLSAEQDDYVDMIQYSVENLLVVINDILDFAKIESGKISLETIPFDVLKTVQDAARSLTFKMDEKGLLLRIVAPDEPLPLALGDPYRLHQVLVNLIGNAIKFTQRGAITITIDASANAGRQLPVTFSVADTGIGIDPNHLGEVFNSFRQADSSIPRLYGGTGLGLTICKNLVELQGGQIGVRSEPGQGSCFYFTIPYSVSEAPLVKEPAIVPQADLLQGLHILLAEDNAVNQLIAVSMLGQWQVQVDMAQNGEEALFKAQQRPYDLILMDIQMPQLDGIEATARLRATPGPNQQVPVIALTADAIRVNPESSHVLGFTDYLTKPYTELALYKILAQVSQRAQASLPPPDAPNLPASRGLHYDFSMLGRLASDESFIAKMLEMFVERVPGQVWGLHEAIEREDWTAVAHAAHGLKTTFGSLSIQPETSHLKKLEELAEARAPKAEFLPLINAVVKGTELFCALFQEELTHKLAVKLQH